ncbi:MAG: hypothetical protein R2836_01835 [Chitinophagales bacterium]
MLFKQKPYIFILIILSSVLLLVFSYYFALERILSADTATYIYNLMNKETFNYGSFRFIAIPTQLLPLLLIKLNASFQTVLISYSVNLMLFHIGVLLVLLLVLKDIEATLILLISHLISSSLMFYYPVSEYQMGLTLTVLLYAILNNNSFLNSKWYWFVVLPLLLIISYAHPLIIIFVSFVFLFVWYHKKEKATLKWGITYLFFLCCYFSKYLFFTVPNDSQNMLELRYLKFFPLDAFLVFWQQTINYDFLVLIALALALVFLIVQRKYLLAVFFILFVYANLYLAMSKLGNQGYMYYHAHIYQMVSFIVALVFVYYGFKIKQPLWAFIYTFIIVLSLVQIFNRSEFSRERMAYFNSLIDKTQAMQTNRGIVQNNEVTFKKNGWFWAIDIETLILSTYQRKEATTVVIKNSESISEDDLTRTDAFIVYWTTFNVKDEFNEAYFYLSPNKYKFILKNEE